MGSVVRYLTRSGPRARRISLAAFPISPCASFSNTCLDSGMLLYDYIFPGFRCTFLRRSIIVRGLLTSTEGGPGGPGSGFCGPAGSFVCRASSRGLPLLLLPLKPPPGSQKPPPGPPGGSFYGLSIQGFGDTLDRTGGRNRVWAWKVEEQMSQKYYKYLNNAGQT